MKGYYTSEGYMGLVNGRYILFANDSEYAEYFTESAESGELEAA